MNTLEIEILKINISLNWLRTVGWDNVKEPPIINYKELKSNVFHFVMLNAIPFV